MEMMCGDSKIVMTTNAIYIDSPNTDLLGGKSINIDGRVVNINGSVASAASTEGPDEPEEMSLLPTASHGLVAASDMSESPESEWIGLKKNAAGDLILCMGQDACADPSNVQDANWKDLAFEVAMVVFSRVPFMKAPRPNPSSRRAADVGGDVALSVPKNAGSYRPDRKLPRDQHGRPVADSDAPHTQLGTKKGRNGDYTQAREFDGNGTPVRDIDFTDHGRPQNHPNPHQHDWIPNPTGGTPQHGPAKPLEMPK